MNLRHSFLCSVAVVASAYVGVGEAQAAERTATFTSGAVARYTNAPNGTDSAKLFSELSITSVIITQTINDPTQSSWLQGNDTTVNVTVKRSGGLPDLIITGATMNWVSNSCTPNGCDYIGLTLPGPVNDGYPALPQGYSKTYILQFGTSTLNLAGLLPDNIDGSANFGNNAFSALDAFYPIDSTAPTISAQTFSYAENKVAGATLATVSATDNTAVTAYRFSATGTNTSADGYYVIDNSGKIALTAAGAAAGVASNDFETAPNQFVLGVQAGDAAGNWSTASNVTLNVTDLDDTAPAIAAGQTFNYVENQTAGAQVGAVAATDAVGVAAFRFSDTGTTTSADGYYQIDSTGKITLTAAGAAAGVATNDFETTPNQFIYGIQAGDAAGNWSAATNVTLNVTDLDDTAPVVAAGQTFSYAENQAAGAQVGAVSATDAGGVTAFRFSANNSTTSADGYFQIDATGKITLTAAGAAAGAATNDFETAPNQFTYGIQAGDAQGLWSAVTNVTLKVTDVNEDSVAFNGATPVDGVPTYTYQYKEKSAEGATLGTVSATGAITSPTFTIVGGNTDGWYQINSSTGAISLTAAGVTSLANDFSRLANTRTLQVQATSGTATATVNVVLIETDATGPVISGPAGTNLASEITVDENQIAVLTLGADEIAEWTIVGGDDQLLFNIDPTTGAITFKSAPDYERPADANGDNVYTFQVQAKDAAGNVTVQTITVRVLDLNAAFTGTNATNGGTASYAFDYNEKSAAGTTLGTVGATGPGTEVYTIESGNDNGWFAINSSTGVITLTEAGAASVANDYLKADNLHTLQVKVTSGPESAVIAVALNELDNAGPLITGPTGGEGAPESAVTVDENQVNVWTLTANEPVTEWKIIGSDDDAAFTIDANGKITFLAPPNYEKPTDKDGNNTYILTVQAKDAAGNVSTQKVTVTIRDLNDAPVFTNTVKDANGNAIYSFDYKERTAKDVELNRVSATGSGPLTFAITGGNDNGWYAINSSTGVITLTAAGAASLANDWETLANSQTLTVTAANTFGDTTAIKVLLNELDIDDTAPLITGPSGGPGAAASAITINEGLTAVTKMTANEPIKTWEISGGPDASKLTIAADGTITFKEAPDFENPTDADKNNTYVIIIRAVDMFGNESFQTLTITIGNVDEIAQKLREIGGKLRSDLRNYAF